MHKIKLLPDSDDSSLPEGNDDWNPPDLIDWMDSVKDEPEYILQDLLPADSKILFSGRAKTAYKSWMGYTLALVVASGKTVGKLIPVNPEGQRVLLLAAEGGGGFNKRRFSWIARSLGIDIRALKARGLLKFSFKEPILLKDVEWVYKLKRYVEKNNIRLLIIDPLIMFSGVDENRSNEWALIMHALNSIGKNGCSIIFVHHLNKSQKDWARDIDEEIRGSTAIAGFYDCHWAFRKKSDNQRHNDLTIRSKDIEEMNFEVRWFIDKIDGVAELKMESMTQEMAQKRKISDVYTELIPTAEYTLRAIAKIADTDTSEATALVKEMISSNMLEVRGSKYVCKAIN